MAESVGYWIGYWIGVLAGSAGVGLLLGFIPLIAGMTTNRQNLGYLGFALSIIAGLLMGATLAFPTALICSSFILLTQPEASNHK
jgi:hypothetical protein